MVLAVVLTAVALAAIVFVVHREDRGGSSVPSGEAGTSRFEALDRDGLVGVGLPRAVLGYEPSAVREALAAAVRLADTDAEESGEEHDLPGAEDEGAAPDTADVEQHPEDAGAGASGGEDEHV